MRAGPGWVWAAPWLSSDKEHSVKSRGSHPRATLLLHNGLHAGTSEPIPKAMFGAGAVALCSKRYRNFSPLQRWLVANVVEA